MSIVTQQSKYYFQVVYRYGMQWWSGVPPPSSFSMVRYVDDIKAGNLLRGVMDALKFK